SAPGGQGLASQCLRFKTMIVLLALAGVLGGVAATKIQSPVYRSRVWLDIQNVNESFLDMRDVSPTATQSSSQELQTQARILQSETLRKRTIARVMRPHQPLLGFAPGNAPAPKSAAYDPESVYAVAESLQVRTADTNRIVEVMCESRNPQL